MIQPSPYRPLSDAELKCRIDRVAEEFRRSQAEQLAMRDEAAQLLAELSLRLDLRAPRRDPGKPAAPREPGRPLAGGGMLRVVPDPDAG